MEQHSHIQNENAIILLYNNFFSIKKNVAKSTFRTKKNSCHNLFNESVAIMKTFLKDEQSTFLLKKSE